MKKILVFGLLLISGVVLTSSGKLHQSHAKQPTGHTLKTVVIDAGHGGKDPGAIGKVLGVKEKDLVLDVSLRLGKLIKSAISRCESFVHPRQRCFYQSLRPC